MNPSEMRLVGNIHTDQVSSDLLGQVMVSGHPICLLAGNELVMGRVIGLELESGGEVDQITKLWNVKLRTKAGDRLVFVRLAD